MPDKFTQAERLIAVDTPLGADRLLLRSFSGAEGISKLFHFQLDMLSEDFNISFDDIVGQNVTVSVKLADGSSERYFNGFVSRFAQLPGEDRLARYQADVVPWTVVPHAHRRLPDLPEQERPGHRPAGF